MHLSRRLFLRHPTGYKKSRNVKVNAMIHRGQVACALAAITLGTAAQAESYLCVASQVSGFHYSPSSGKWSSMSFNAESKYVVSRATSEDPELAKIKRWGASAGHGGPIDWIVRKVGEQNYEAVCAIPQKDRSEDVLPVAMGVMKCSGIMSEFLVNLTTLRFQNYFWGSYSLNLKPGDDSAIEIGECSKL